MRQFRRKAASLMCAVLAFSVVSASYGGPAGKGSLLSFASRSDGLVASGSDAPVEDEKEKRPEIIIEEDDGGDEDATASEAVRFAAFSWTEEFDGVTVELTAKRGILPEGTSAEIQELLPAQAATDSNAAQERFSFDITLYDENGDVLDGSWQENGKVNVEFSGSRIDAAKERASAAEIVYVDEEGSEEVLKVIPMNEAMRSKEGVNFDAEHFSVYDVIFMDANAFSWGTWDEEIKTLTITDLSASGWSGYKSKAETLIINDPDGDISSTAFSTAKTLKNLHILQCRNIEKNAFNQVPLETVKIDVCGDIGSNAFNTFSSSAVRNRLRTLEIGRCKDIGTGAFSRQQNLESLKIGTCTSIGSQAFMFSNGLKILEIGECSSIGDSAFQAAGTKGGGALNVILGGCSIGRFAFYKAEMGRLTLTGIPELKDNAFDSATIESIALSGVTSLGNGVFEGVKGLKELVIENIDVISDNTFKIYDDTVNKVKKITLKNVQKIGNYAFKNFKELETVDIEGSCQSVGAHAFSGCESLKTIEIADETRLGYSDSLTGQKAIRERIEAILSGGFQLLDMSIPIKEIKPEGWTSAKLGLSNSAGQLGDTQLTKEAKWSDSESTVADVLIKAYYTANRQMDFIFVADCSNSMAGFGSSDAMNSNFYNMQSKMMDVADELLSNDQELDTRIAFSTFGETEGRASGFFEKGQQQEAKDYIWNDIVNYYSNTNYSVGFQGALKLAKENAGRNTTVIFISDGQPFYPGDGGVNEAPEEYYGAKEAAAVRAEGVQILSVLQQVPSDEVELSVENMKKLTDEEKIFPSTDLESFSAAVNASIEYAYATYTLTDTVDPAFDLDESSVKQSAGTVTLGTDKNGNRTLTWILSMSDGADPFVEHTLRFKEQLKKVNGKYPTGLFDTNEGDAPLNSGTGDVNRVPTPALPRKAKEGNLTVSKTVTGNKGNRTKDFDFYVVLGDETINGTFGDMTFENGKTMIQLRHGESKTASGLPEGTAFSVREENNYAYTVSVNGKDGSEYNGIIEEGKNTKAAFTNHRSGSEGGGKNPGGGTTPSGKVTPGGPGDKTVQPEITHDDTGTSPHPEINRLPVMGIEGPGYESENGLTGLSAAVAGTKSAEEGLSVIPELKGQYERNKDLGGWLTVPGTGFGYPVMYTPENWEYYLHHNFAGQADKVGIPFFGEGSEIGGDNTLIHGHNVNGTLQFGYIWNYQYPAFRAEHPSIDFKTIYDGASTYEVMAIFFAPVYPADTEGVFKWYQYVGNLSERQFNYFVEQAKAASLYDTGINASYGDKLITLETCADNETNTRLVVVARRSMR